MTVEIRGNLSANNLVLSEKFRRYSTGTILFTGVGARVEIDGPVSSGDITLTIGSGASVSIGQDCVIGRLSLNLFGEGARIDIGRSVGFAGSVNLSTHEGGRINIGAQCLIAGDTVFAASDGHPIFDVSTGERINQAADICVGEHVWIAARAMVLKGADIGRNSVVGAGSIVTGHFGPNSLIVGNPARVLRSGINWRE
ncbi:acyltransferase [Methylobacterium sp. NEAU 140]|uniref:acyltransferase n=1 Tax=Methylobacterium sp. NEAU 140 TaxID=3064945 RepID=UPI00273255E5|nr:acyltransferase [Methylobacterium sp. NEAU 140]MDP4025987.1 acyltransferase [Methylobacterium sp. NEAU 140]